MAWSREQMFEVREVQHSEDGEVHVVHDYRTITAGAAGEAKAKALDQKCNQAISGNVRDDLPTPTFEVKHVGPFR